MMRGMLGRIAALPGMTDTQTIENARAGEMIGVGEMKIGVETMAVEDHGDPELQQKIEMIGEVLVEMTDMEIGRVVEVHIEMINGVTEMAVGDPLTEIDGETGMVAKVEMIDGAIEMVAGDHLHGMTDGVIVKEEGVRQLGRIDGVIGMVEGVHQHVMIDGAIEMVEGGHQHEMTGGVIGMVAGGHLPGRIGGAIEMVEGVREEEMKDGEIGMAVEGGTAGEIAEAQILPEMISGAEHQKIGGVTKKASDLEAVGRTITVIIELHGSQEMKLPESLLIHGKEVCNKYTMLRTIFKRTPKFK